MDRTRDVRRAWLLSLVSVVLGAAVAIVALATGFDTGSLSTIGFGLDAAIDSSASVILVWRFALERSAAHRGEHAEALAERLVGIVLCIAATALAAGGAAAVLLHESASSSDMQIVLLGVSIAQAPSRPTWNEGSWFRRFPEPKLAGEPDRASGPPQTPAR